MHRHAVRALCATLLASGFTVGLASAAPAEEYPIISGTVTDADDNPIDSMCVTVFDTEGGYVNNDYTYDGEYSIWAGEDGEYVVQFGTNPFCQSELNYIAEYYDDAATIAEATPVVIGDGVDDDYVDAELAVGSSISGRVTAQGGEPLEHGGCVAAYEEGRDEATEGFSSYTESDENGDYTLEQLRPGTAYHLKFDDCSGNAIAQWYEDSDEREGATLITATEAGIEGIDQSLPASGRITGTVSDAQGDIVGTGTCIRAYDATQPFDPDSYIFSSFTNEFLGGEWEINGFDGGSYKLLFANCGEGDWANEWWQDARTFESATSVTVERSQVVSGIDAVIGPPDRVAPDTILTSGPAQGSTISSSTTTFTFEADDESDVTFACWLDGEVLDDCTSPLTLTRLAQGAHTLTVEATDVFGNVDRRPVRRSFSVDVPSQRCQVARSDLDRAKRMLAKDKKKIAKFKGKLENANKASKRKMLKRKVQKWKRAATKHRAKLRTNEVRVDRHCR